MGRGNARVAPRQPGCGGATAMKKAGVVVASSAKGATWLQPDGIPRRQKVRPGAHSHTGIV